MGTSARRQRKPVIEVIDDAMAEVLSAKTGAERLAMAAEMYRAAQRMLRSQLAAQHPEWDRECVEAEVARRLRSASG